jgi:hypothetical protein
MILSLICYFFTGMQTSNILAQSHGAGGWSSWVLLPSPVSPGKSYHTPSLASQLSPEVARSSSAPSTISRTKAQRLKRWFPGTEFQQQSQLFLKEAKPLMLPPIGYRIYFLDVLGFSE